MYESHPPCPSCQGQWDIDADCVGDPPRYVDCSTFHHQEGCPDQEEDPRYLA